MMLFRANLLTGPGLHAQPPRRTIPLGIILRFGETDIHGPGTHVLTIHHVLAECKPVILFLTRTLSMGAAGLEPATTWM